jgi:hypothetical protein
MYENVDDKQITNIFSFVFLMFQYMLEYQTNTTLTKVIN